jgi:hypothetical protein
MARIRMGILSLLAVFAVGAFAASTASAHRVWLICQELPGEGKEPPTKYDNHECNTQVKALKERKWEELILPVGQTASLQVVKNSTATLVAGTEEIVCETIKLAAGNTIENVEVEGKGPTGRDNGTTEFSKCKNKNKPACTVTEPIKVTSPTSLVENTAGTKIYDMFRPEGRKELTPAEVTAKGEPASKEAEEKLSKYTTIKQTGAGCIAATTVEGDGVAAEISPESLSVKKRLIFPCPTPITPVKLWNGIQMGLKLKAFTVAAKECIPEIEVELTSKWAWSVS